MYDRSAIVLKKISPHKIALLDADCGRLDAVSLLPPGLGAHIEYTVMHQKRELYFLERHSIIDWPFFLGRSDILFWHHILELSYYFMPVGSYAPQLFELLSFLYTVDKESRWQGAAKKLYLFRLLSVIGVQIEMPRITTDVVEHLMSILPHQMHEKILESESEKILDEWLRVCVAQHPAIEQFKTIHFLASE